MLNLYVSKTNFFNQARPVRFVGKGRKWSVKRSEMVRKGRKQGQAYLWGTFFESQNLNFEVIFHKENHTENKISEMSFQLTTLVFP